MTNKETFLSFLYKAREDYQTSYTIATTKVIDVSLIENLTANNKIKRNLYRLTSILIGQYDKRNTNLKEYNDQLAEYRSLKTNWGLRHYFVEAHNTINVVRKHLADFRPATLNNEQWSLWFSCNTSEGFKKRLEIINNAIDYYSAVPEAEVPFLLHGDMNLNITLYAAVERGEVKGEYALKAYEYINDNYDDYFTSMLDEQG
ncbi:MAG: hypothetical protein EOO85_10145 [Pedobacter sp.]|nr:MAG: hypothetical protein EOO85_10145 [Pedobacter sp.]